MTMTTTNQMFSKPSPDLEYLNFPPEDDKAEPNVAYKLKAYFKVNKPFSFKARDYDVEEALEEAARNGVWASKSFLEEVIPVSSLDITKSPATPLREGQAALFVASGMLNNKILTDATGQSVMVKGRTIKEYVKKKEEQNEKGETTSVTERETIRTEIKVLNMATGEITDVEQTNLKKFLAPYWTSVRRQMLTSFPPNYLPTPGKEQPDEVARQLEKGIVKLLRRPKGGQALGIVGTAKALIKDNAALLWSEQGTGKTLMGSAAAWLSGCERVLVVCPPHLVRKWVKEIKKTIPGAQAEIIERHRENGRMLSAIESLDVAVERIKKHERLMDAAGKKPGIGPEARPPYFLVMSDRTITLEPKWKPAVITRHVKDDEGDITDIYACPKCGQNLIVLEGKYKDKPISLKELSTKKMFCENLVNKEVFSEVIIGEGKKKRIKNIISRKCGNALFQVEARKVWDDVEKYKGDGGYSLLTKWNGETTEYNGRKFPVVRDTDWFDPHGGPGEGPRKMALALVIRKKYSDFFDLALLDECHMFKEINSGQGVAAGIIAQSCKRVLAMSGTLSGGKASDLFYLLYRFNAKFRKSWKLREKEKWVNQYGVMERKTYTGKNKPREVKTADGAGSLRRESTREIYTEKPGMTPKILENLIENTVFLKIGDVSKELPPYNEHVEWFDMPTRMAEEYRKFESDLSSEIKRTLMQEGSQRLLGAMRSLLSWPDKPFETKEVIDPKWKTVVCRAEAQAKDVLYPKEEWLLDKYQNEKAAGRKMLIFVSDTDKGDITPRLKWVLEEAKKSQGVHAKVAILKSNTVDSPSKREEWVERRVQEGYDVLICHPRLVQTGLDLLAFPTILFYQIEYSIYVQMQAERRSWRLGQTENVHVHYLIYRDTAQKNAIKLQAKKKRTVMMLGGDLDAGGMMALGNEEDAEDSLFMDIARALVNKDQGKLESDLEAVAVGSNEAASSDDVTEQEGFSLESVLDQMSDIEQEAASMVLDDDMTPEQMDAAIEAIYFKHEQEQKALEVAETVQHVVVSSEEKAFVATAKPKITLEELKAKMLELKEANKKAKKEPKKVVVIPETQLSMF